MAGTNFHSVVTSTLDAILTDNDGLIVMAACTGAPPTTASIFAHGAICRRTDSGTGNKAMYENVGSSAVPSWNLMGDITAGEIALVEGSLLVGNNAGVATALDAKTANQILVGNGTTLVSVAVSGDLTNSAGVFTIGTLAHNLAVSRTLTSQTAVNTSSTLALTTDSTYLTGTNVTYSGGRGSATLDVASTWSATAGGFHGVYSAVTASGAFNDANGGVVNVKGVTTTSAAMTAAAGIYGGQFIARHNHGTNKAANAAPYIGVEGVVTQSTVGQIGTAIGVSAAFHIPADAAVFDGGAVWRGIQITMDNSSANNPSEATGLCIWNMAGAHTNGIKFVDSGTGFTNGIDLTAAMTNGIKVVGATELGVSIVSAALTAGDSYSGVRSVVGTADANNSYGSAAYFQADVTGTQAGTFHYVTGAWANINSGTVGAGQYICAQDNGIYEDASATITGAKVIFGMRMEKILSDTDALTFPWSINAGNNSGITALIETGTIDGDLGGVTNAGTDSGQLVPLYYDANGNKGYIKIYTLA